MYLSVASAKLKWGVTKKWNLEEVSWRIEFLWVVTSCKKSEVVVESVPCLKRCPLCKNFCVRSDKPQLSVIHTSFHKLTA